MLSFRFDDLSSLIVTNGGRIVDLDEPKLTHVIMDERDTSRRLELMQKTSKYVLTALFRTKYMPIGYAQTEEKTSCDHRIYSSLFG